MRKRRISSLLCNQLLRLILWPLRSFWPLNGLRQPQRLDMTSKLNSVTSITMSSKCILLLTAILVEAEAILATKRPQRSQFTLHQLSDLIYLCFHVFTASRCLYLIKATDAHFCANPLLRSTVVCVPLGED